MRPTQHPTSNRVLGAPAGWDQGELPCGAIAITDVVLDDGRPAVMTFWRPSADELVTLNAGGLVALAIIGKTMPPASIQVEPTC